MNSISRRPRALSLFSGAGGLDIGFHKAGFDIAACVEIEPIFAQTLRLNGGQETKHYKVIEADISELDPGSLGLGNVDFIFGGPPCQSFSAIGRRAGGIAGTNIAKGSLFEHYCRFLAHFRPTGFLCENVRGILGSNKGEDWKKIVSSFEELGYRLSYRVLDSADFGVPQHRERLIMVGALNTPFKFPRPTHGPDSSNGTPYVTASAALKGIEDPEEPVHTYSGKYGHLLAEVPPGMNYHFFTKELGYPEPIFAWRSRFSDFLYKADPNQPVRTIVAQLGKYSGPFHWKNRKFTVEEFKRLQTFPDDYNFAGGENRTIQQIGNSVPPLLAERIAEAIANQYFGTERSIEYLSDVDSLSFDSRKSKKAYRTRTKRRVHENSTERLPLFSYFDSIFSKEVDIQESTKDWVYVSSSKRVAKTTETPHPSGRTFSVVTRQESKTTTIHVRETNSKERQDIIEYRLQFQHPFNNGCQEIVAILSASDDDCIFTLWDSIEDYVQSISGYKAMIDLFGHFTEPHPSFVLEATIVEKPQFWKARFAAFYSRFDRNKELFPLSILNEHAISAPQVNKTAIEIVQELRRNRFDVRVSQTNSTIPEGYFRCCYPFTTSLNRQVFTRWTPEKEVVGAN